MAENEYSVSHGFRLRSSYQTSTGEKLWIITEADRCSVTRVTDRTSRPLYHYHNHTLREEPMDTVMSACGVLCSDCPAYLAKEKGIAHQKRTADAWLRIYGRSERVEDIACGGCLSPDDQAFHTSRNCKARRCCIARGFSSCAECSAKSCADLGRAQSVWDGVPEIGKTLSHADFVNYAQPYCDPRRRLAEARAAGRHAENGNPSPLLVAKSPRDSP